LTSPRDLAVLAAQGFVRMSPPAQVNAQLRAFSNRLNPRGMMLSAFPSMAPMMAALPLAQRVLTGGGGAGSPPPPTPPMLAHPNVADRLNPSRVIEARERQRQQQQEMLADPQLAAASSMLNQLPPGSSPAFVPYLRASGGVTVPQQGASVGVSQPSGQAGDSFQQPIQAGLMEPFSGEKVPVTTPTPTGTGDGTAPAAPTGGQVNIPAWIDEVTTEQLQYAMAEPDAGVRFFLAMNGINEDSLNGRMLLQDAPMLPALYEMITGVPGAANEFPDDYFVFMQGYYDRMTKPASQVQDVRSAMRRKVLEQVDQVLENPESPLAQGLAQLLAQYNDPTQGGRGYPENEFYWNMLFAPAMLAMGATPMSMQVYKARLDTLYNNWNMMRVAGDQRDFVTFLRDSGYTQDWGVRR
jgi:hypothetical protein